MTTLSRSDPEIPVLNSWNEFPRGRDYLFKIQKYMQPWWPKFFGVHLLKIGPLSAEIDTHVCAIPYQINVGVQSDQMQVIADLNLLAFSEKSDDVCLLFNTLSDAPDPHRLLREVDRILVDDGWLLISHFNSFSVLGIGKLLPVIRRRQPYACRMFSRMRVLDWLHLLNYEVVHQKGRCCISTHLSAISCLSLLIARKRTTPLTLDTFRLTKPKRCFGQIGTENYKM